MRSIILAASILAASTGFAAAAECVNPYTGMTVGEDCSVTRDSWVLYYTERYQNVDRNQDGMISQDEWLSHYDEDFIGRDIDKNGTLSQDELQGDMQRGS